MAASRYLSIGQEAAYGDGTAGYDEFIAIKDESIVETVEWFEHENVQNRTIVDAYVTKRRVEGDFTWHPKPSNIGHVARIVMGKEAAVTGTATAGVSVHTFTPGTVGSTNPSATINVYRNTSLETKYAGCMLDIELAASMGEPLVATATVYGQRIYEYGSAGDTPTWATDHAYILTSGGVTILGASNSYVSDVSVSIENGYDPDGDTTIGTAYPRDMREQGFRVSGSLSLTRPNGTMHQYYRGGSSTSILLSFNAKTALGSTQAMTLSMPKVYLTGAGPGNISGNDLNPQDYDFVAAYDSGSAAALIWKIKNSDDSRYTA